MNKNYSELNKKCSLLPYTVSYDTSENVLSSTCAAIERLFDEFGLAEVIGALSKIWSAEKAVKFFKLAGIKRKSATEIRTIAVSYFRAYNGGVERVNAELMDLWIRMGYRVVFFTDEPAEIKDYPYPDTVKRIVIPSYDQLQARLKALQRHCEAEYVDLFINHRWTESRFLWECELIKALGIPYIQYCHGHFSICFANGRPALIQPDAFSLCDLIIALSETNARFYQLCGCRTYLIQNPVPELLKKDIEHATHDSGRVLMIGRLSEEKYPMEALQIFKLVLDRCQRAVLDIVGDGSEEILHIMKSFIHSNHMENAVFFHGLKTDDELQDYYKNASCVLFTSKMEGYPMTVLETKAFGLPLVMYDLPFLTLTKDRKGLLTAEPGDICSMADHVVSILENAELRRKLGGEARESFESFADYDPKAAWEEVFDICCDNQTVSEAYYDPEDLSDSERLIIPSLLEKIKEGYSSTFYSSREFKLGSLLLRFPRKVKNYLDKR